LIAKDDFYGADPRYYAAKREYIEGTDEDEKKSQEFLQMLVSQRRGLFFKIPKEAEKELAIMAGWPHIFAIGNTAILNFQKGEDIIIPIEGQNLRDENSLISVNVSGPFSLKSGSDYTLNTTGSGTSPSQAFLEINKNVTGRLNSKDNLLVNISIAEKPQLDRAVAANNSLSSLPEKIYPGFTDTQIAEFRNGNLSSDTVSQYAATVAFAGLSTAEMQSIEQWLASKDSSLKTAFDKAYQEAKAVGIHTNAQVHLKPGRLMASDSRSFILFTSDDYRNEVLAHNIQIQNITAFPLPETETKKLFGDFVGNKYYAVRLTLRNSTEQDQIISLGQIKAYGRALVEPVSLGSKPGDYLTYTIPVELAPQSQQQIYTMVQIPKGTILNESGQFDNDSYRDWYFGALELCGALAAAYGAGFAANEDYIKAVALTTGAVTRIRPDRRSDCNAALIARRQLSEAACSSAIVTKLSIVAAMLSCCSRGGKTICNILNVGM